MIVERKFFFFFLSFFCLLCIGTNPSFFFFRWYGECYDFCAEQRKEFDIPECKGVSGKKQVCEYMKNDCGKVFGGCYPAEGPIPGWGVPACP